ncbi:MAG TPA: ABC transporter ATP-binding protein [Actinomycetota bacterium]|nr:ABC transporter ATP-binding protein [Actinomycetota bacterium]
MDTLLRMTVEQASAVACRGLAKRFGNVVALDEVTLTIAAGEIVALLGPSGCGKTTFLRVIAGFERADAGVVELEGRVVDGPDAFVAPERRRAPLVFQDYALFPHMTVAANVGYGVARDERGRVEEVMRLVGLEGLGDRYPHELSGGQQQRVALARALAPRPAIVLLDEPFSNLDADLRARVRGEVRTIIRAAGATAVFVTHDQSEAFDIADRIAVMHAGRIEQLGRPEEIYHVPETRFVADFVGRAEFIPATVTADRIDSELGSFAFAPGEVRPGEAELMLRPEDIVLANGNGGATAEVIERRFQGPVNVSVVRLPSGRVVSSVHSSQNLFRPGDRVHVSFAPDHLVVFRGDRRIAWMAVREHTGTDVPDA